MAKASGRRSRRASTESPAPKKENAKPAVKMRKYRAIGQGELFGRRFTNKQIVEAPASIDLCEKFQNKFEPIDTDVVADVTMPSEGGSDGAGVSGRQGSGGASGSSPHGEDATGSFAVAPDSGVTVHAVEGGFNVVQDDEVQNASPLAEEAVDEFVTELLA